MRQRYWSKLRLLATAAPAIGALGHVLPPIFNNLIFFQLTLELHKVRQQLCAVASPNILIFSERELTFTFAMLSPVRLPVVCRL